MPRAAYGYRLKMDSDHARELLARERARIEHALADLRQEMAGEEEQDPFEPSDVGRDLFDKELGEGLAERLREELEAVGRAKRAPGRGYLRRVGRERQANPGRSARDDPVGRTHGGGAGAL